MSVKVQDNTNKVIVDTQRSGSLALRYMLDDIQTLSNPKTPRKEGFLRKNVLKQVMGLTAKIIWGQRYASILETKQFVNYTTPGTGPHYAENAVRTLQRSPENAMRKARLI